MKSVPDPPLLEDLACVVHLHSCHSDGTGTVPEIAAAAERAGVDVVLLTDHDTLAARAAGEERRYGRVLVCVGEEVSPKGGNHFLAFGLREPIEHDGLGPQEIVDAVARAGGFGFLSHPFSRGSSLLGGRFKGMPWSDLGVSGYTGVELWSFVTDTVESLGGVRDVLRFIASPGRVVDDPPAENLAAWDRLTAAGRRVVAIGGLDAHQVGWRVGGRVPLRLMSYRRSFSRLRTHVLVESPPVVEDDARRAAVYDALREGRCYLAMDAIAPARGFRFWGCSGDLVSMGAEGSFADGATLHARLPRPAALTLRRNGQVIASRWESVLDEPAPGPGVYRLEARLPSHGRQRTWILSNPVYLR